MSGPRRIQLLPPSLRDRIAAGEVIQRPASALKELVENALDAGATEVVVDAEEGGTVLIRVADNGHGIMADDLPLAFENHATSKIHEPDELDRIQTLGFRGEALASMRACAQVLLHSRHATSTDAWSVRTGPDGTLRTEPAPRAVGTTVELRDLFGSIPARKKFLKSVRTEANQLLETMERYALAFPTVAMRYSHNGKIQLDVRSGTRAERVARWLGDDVARNGLELRESGPLFSYELYAAQPRHVSARPDQLLVFVNQRPIRDRQLMHGVAAGFSRWIPDGHYPMGVLYLSVDPTWVDVNAHPAKSEVRFADARLLHDFLAKSLHHGLEQQAGFAPLPSTTAESAPIPGIGARHGEPGIRSSYGGGQPLPAAALRDYPVSRGYGPAVSVQPALAMNPESGRQIRIVGQTMAKYILAEVDGQLHIIDQHAAHEALNFARIRDSILSGRAGDTQMLLAPHRFRLGHDAWEALRAETPAVRALGFDLEFSDGEWITLRGTPEWSDSDPETFLTQWAYELCHGSRATPDGSPLVVFAAERACKSSLRANQRLSPAEMHALVSRLYQLSDGAACPHGRPTRVTYSEYDLDTLFHRTGH